MSRVPLRHGAHLATLATLYLIICGSVNLLVWQFMVTRPVSTSDNQNVAA